MEHNRYCTECGYQLEPEMEFCPVCGRVVGGSHAEEEMIARQEAALDRMNRAARSRLLACLLVYAIPAIVSGIVLMIDSVPIADGIWSDADFRQVLDDYGVSASRDEVLEGIRYAAKLIVISGACAAVCALLVHLGRFRVLATICCGAAALLCYWSVLGMIIGILVTWRVFRSSSLFTDRRGLHRMEATRVPISIAVTAPSSTPPCCSMPEGRPHPASRMRSWPSVPILWCASIHSTRIQDACG